MEKEEKYGINFNQELEAKVAEKFGEIRSFLKNVMDIEGYKGLQEIKDNLKESVQDDPNDDDPMDKWKGHTANEEDEIEEKVKGNKIKCNTCGEVSSDSDWKKNKGRCPSCDEKFGKPVKEEDIEEAKKNEK